jgi:large subunit ribosomal protein L10
MDRSQKEALVKQMRKELSAATTVIVVQQNGLTVEEVSNLRRQIRENGSTYRVLKNTIARLAVRDTCIASIEPFFEGPTAVAYANDPVSAAKVIAKFSKTNPKISVLGGILEGKILNKTQIQFLADLPSVDELRARIVGLITAPATKIARVIQEPVGQLARLMNAYATK